MTGIWALHLYAVGTWASLVLRLRSCLRRAHCATESCECTAPTEQPARKIGRVKTSERWLKLGVLLRLRKLLGNLAMLKTPPALQSNRQEEKAERKLRRQEKSANKTKQRFERLMTPVAEHGGCIGLPTGLNSFEHHVAREVAKALELRYKIHDNSDSEICRWLEQTV